jgi:phosphoribosylanthranilate isomerase
MTTLIKICGLSTPATLDAALQAGADMVGFVRFARSPRHVELDLARALSERARGRALRVALVVDPTDAELDDIVAVLDPDLLQLHGRETPERVEAIRARFGRPVMKALGIAEAADLAAAAHYRPHVERLLLDAKPPRTADALPGGNGRAFDWQLLAGLDPRLPFMLSGGLSPDNVTEAIAATGARAVDVSSGVENRPGEKDLAKIEAFVKAARAAFAALDRKSQAHEATLA